MEMYRCPKCHEPLISNQHSFLCANHHCYDIAKSGYVNLSLHQKKAQGDNKEMIQARTEFLQQGYYKPLQQCLIRIIQQYPSSFIVDAGCGQGYYTNAFAKAMPQCMYYGFDLSKTALKTASKKIDNANYALASIADLPLVDACADMIISIFAPIYEKEFNRILKPGGYLLKVGPGPHHLWELKQQLYEKVYENKYPENLKLMTLVKEESLKYEITMQNTQDIQALLMMTPYAYRTSQTAIQRLKAMTQLSTTLAFYIQIWQKQ